MGSVTAEACAEWRGMAAMHAIGRATDEESRALDEHLRGCDDCRHERSELLAAADALTWVDPSRIDRFEVEPPIVDPVGVATPVVLPDLTGAAPGSDRRPGEPAVRRALPRHRRLVGLGVGLVAAAAAVAAAVVLGAPSAPPGRAVALTGEKGVEASVLLADQSSGTRATLTESGQAPGQVLTVSMKASSGRWWVAGSYRTTVGVHSMKVELSCAVPPNRITDVWITDQSGRTVLNGYADRTVG